MNRISGSAEERLSGFSKDKARLLRLLNDKRSRPAQRITPCDRSSATGILELPTSWAQQRLWFIDQLEGGSTAYHLTVAARLRGEIDASALQNALNAIVQRHEVLRTVFATVDGEPRQVICAEGRLPLRMVNLSAVDEAECETQIHLQKTEELHERFDLRKGPLIRARLLRVSAEDHTLLITMHHIISDGWSMGVFIRECAELYAAYREGRPNPLPLLPVQYADYAQWQKQWLHGEPLEKQRSYWRARLEGATPQLDLPTDRPRPAVQSYRGANVDILLDSTLTGQLKALALKHHMTLFMVLYAGWALLLSRLSGQQDVVIGTPVGNRQRAELEGMIGFFVNMLVLRADVRGESRVGEFLQQVKDITLGAYDHQDLPFERVVEVLKPPRSLSRHPIFQVTLALQNAPATTLRLPGVTVALEEGIDEPAKFDLLLSLEEGEHDIKGVVNYATDLFDRNTVERWLASFQMLLKAMTQDTQGRLDDLPILPEAERRQILESFNATDAPYPHEKLIHELFEEQVERTPDTVAVTYGGQSLTYRNLNSRANQLAHSLRSEGVGSDQPVALCMERGVDMMVGLLGILKAGGAYVPLDPQYPTERLALILKDALPRVVLTQERSRGKLPSTEARVIALDSDWQGIAQQPASNPDRSGLNARHLAYVIYTSGSTGTPKGVMIEHTDIVNVHQSLEPVYGPLAVCERVALNASLNFDASVQQIVQLLSGRTISIVPHELRWDAEKMLQFLQDNQIACVDCTPMQLKSWVSSGLLDSAKGSKLRTVLVGGEAIDPELWYSVARVREPAFYNVYGPTECSVESTIALLEDNGASPHIGHAMPNRRVYILDDRGHPVPIGVSGEIYIGGAGVGRGYLNRPELTAERFLRDPFSTAPQARMYKTGDLGRWRPDGSIEYLGRNDHQVKIRGFRIELGEIESQLLHHPQVKEAVVLAREDVPGEKRLGAYVVPRKVPGLESVLSTEPTSSADALRVQLSAEPTLSAETLRTHLKPVLPDHMVPSAFVLLERFPLSPNGKLDRKALPAPERGAYASREYEPPQGEVEEILAGIWQSLLRVERVGRRDNFFELGGHSLLIVQMLERLRRVGLSAEVRRVFESPTLTDLAGALSLGAANEYEVPPNLIPPGSEVITPAMLPLVQLTAEHIDRIARAVPGGAPNIQDIYPLAPLQEGMLFHHLLHSNGADAYVRPMLLSLSSKQRLDEFIQALQSVIDRHDVLRTAVLWEQLPRPVQVVYRRATLRVHEVALDPNRDPTEQVQEWMHPNHQRLDLRQAPLLQLQVAADPQGSQWHVLLQLHHIVGDNTSREIILSEVVAHMEGAAQSLPESVPYRNHVAQALAYAQMHDAESFFRSKLAEIDEPSAPFALLDVYGDGSAVAEFHEDLDPLLAQRTRMQARRLGVSAATVFHAAWGLVVAHTSAREEVVFGSVLLGRLQGSAGAKRILGMFINTLPLRLRLREVTTQGLIEQTQRELIELLMHEQASLAVAQRCSGIVGSAPLFSTLLNYRHHAPNPEAEWERATGVRVSAYRDRTNYPILVSVDDLAEGFVLSAQTDQRIDPRRITGYLRSAVESVVQALQESPLTPALSLSILPPGEREVLAAFNATEAPYPRERLVHELFEEQARRTPQAVAVEFEGKTLTYAALNVKANQLARYLLNEGVGPDQLVGICVARSLEMVVGLLGILKAGGAYVPLDPNYPRERLQYMLADAAPQVVLTQEELRGVLPETPARVIALDTTLRELSGHVGENLPATQLGLNPEQAVYVIYTSGSTGHPKGTQMPHRAMVNLIHWHRHSLSAGEGRRVLQFAALSFDVAFQETFSTLCTGGTLVLLNEWIRRDAHALSEFLSHHRIQRLFVPPLMLQSLAECATPLGATPLSATPSQLQEIITAGEPLRISPQIVDWVRRLDGCRVHNHYGPTETHVVTALTLSGDPQQWPALPAIGRPIANVQIQVLDGQRQPVPLGVAGEIYIGGVALAHGYRGRPELTEQRFVTDPNNPESGSRLYRTGDLGRWQADGTLEYLGRNDDQVKLRGYRIELGEIEAQLLRHAAVREAVVVVREDTPGEKRLVAYLIAQNQDPPSAEALRTHLKAVLPEHMIPSAFVPLESWPQTPNGKLNRRGLPAPEQGAYASSQYEPPQGETETALAAIWAQLLHLPRVGRHDNFFELGGHSLHGMKLVSQVSDVLNVNLPVIAVFQSPTIQDMARVVESLRPLEVNRSEEVEESEFEEGLL